MTKRERVKHKTNCRCGYCGQRLGIYYHIDHIKPIYRGRDGKPDHAGEDDEDNLIASCKRCNLWKKTYTVEEFRNEIAKSVKRTRDKSSTFRLAEDYGLIEEKQAEVIFYFERIQQ